MTLPMEVAPHLPPHLPFITTSIIIIIIIITIVATVINILLLLRHRSKGWWTHHPQVYPHPHPWDQDLIGTKCTTRKDWEYLLHHHPPRLLPPQIHTQRKRVLTFHHPSFPPWSLLHHPRIANHNIIINITSQIHHQRVNSIHSFRVTGHPNDTHTFRHTVNIPSLSFSGQLKLIDF